MEIDLSKSQRGTSRREFIISAAGVAAAALVAGAAAPPAAAQSGKAAADKQFASKRHRTAYLEAGPADGPLMIFLHGFPDLGLIWRPQLQHFAAAGWRCVAPDMRGYGGSSVPTRVADYSVREMVDDMVELHDALGGKPAIWVGHSLGCNVVWAMATHHPKRCIGVVNLTVPYIARGNVLSNLVPLVNRDIYPVDRYPFGQWDYMAFFGEHFTKAVRDFETHAEQSANIFYSRGSADGLDKPTPLANIRAQGGWFPPGSKAPPRETLLPSADRQRWLAAFARNGFSGPAAWYLNDVPNAALAAEAPAFGRILLPVLFLGADWDTVCDTVYGRFAEPMREDCSDLTEVNIAAGHMLMLERPDDVNRAIAKWLAARRIAPVGRLSRLWRG